MSVEFSPDEFWAATPKERIVKCREMAAQAERLAASASTEARKGYVELAAQWRALADEMELWDRTPASANL
jgi:hypothetical protein